jgi:diguanylate cyclase (GGDEF)-like protein
MQIDLPTISAVHVTITALLGVVLLLIWARGRESPLIGWWGLALLVQAVGLAMTALLFFANVPLAIAGAIMILGDAIKWKAAREFVYRPAPIFWILLGPVAFLVAVQSGLLHSFDYRLDALSTALALYNFATAFQFSQAKGEQPASRWPVVVLLVILGCFQMLWFPLNIAMPINEARWVAASIWFPTVMLLALLLRVAIAFVVLSLAKERSNIERRNEALTDALTGLPNRRALFEAADAISQERDRTGCAISVLIFDLDYFKRTNDRFGHELGDRVLKLFATTVRTHLEGSSIVARLGGEEFAAILPSVDRLKAVETGEAVRHAFANSGAFVDGLPVGATVSVGVAWDGGGGGDLNALFRRADAALYAAKRAGRNRVEFLEPDAEDLLPELKAMVRAADRGSSSELTPRPWRKRRA